MRAEDLRRKAEQLARKQARNKAQREQYDRNNDEQAPILADVRQLWAADDAVAGLDGDPDNLREVRKAMGPI